MRRDSHLEDLAISALVLTPGRYQCLKGRQLEKLKETERGREGRNGKTDKKVRDREMTVQTGEERKGK